MKEHLPVQNLFSIRRRITISFIILGVLFFIGAFFNFNFQYTDIISSNEAIIQKHLKVRDYCLRLNIGINQAALHYQDYISYTKNQDKLQGQVIWEKEVLTYSERILNHINTEDELYYKIINDFRSDITKLEVLFEDASQVNFKNPSVKEDISNKITVLTKNLNTHIKNIDGIEQKAIHLKVKSVNALIGQIMLVTGISFLLLLIIGVFLTSQSIRLVRKQINDIASGLKALFKGDIFTNYQSGIKEFSPILEQVGYARDSFAEIKKFADEVSKGNFDSELEAFENQGELGEALAGMQSSLKEISDETRERNWINEGINRFNQIIQEQSENQTEFYHSVIKYLVDYLEVNQGGFFVKEDDDIETYLNLEATFAFNRKKYLKKSIQFGEGLVGQSWREKDTIYLTEIPKNYTTIASGMGEAQPLCVLIVPLVTDDQVQGILEFSSFKLIDDYQIDFLHRISESIAISISRVKISERNQMILKESQMISEQMKSQEEEMRMNMESMASTQEQIKATQLELSAQGNVIRNSFTFLEMSPSGVYRFVNKKILALSGYKEEELIGQHYSTLIKDKSSKARLDWFEILKGEIKQGEYIRYTKFGERYWVYEVVFPIYSVDGEVEKVYAIGLDISKYKEIEKTSEDPEKEQVSS